MRRPEKFVLTSIVLILIVVGIVGILMPREGSDGRGARKMAAQWQIKDFEKALDLFKADNGRYPTGPDALQGLVKAPSGASNWHQYLDSIPLDPWQHPYVYECPGKHHTNSYDIFSAGPDGRAGTDDDIGNW